MISVATYQTLKLQYLLYNFLLPSKVECQKCTDDKKFHSRCLPDRIGNLFSCDLLQETNEPATIYDVNTDQNNKQPWHNENAPFVLKKWTKRIKRCQGCRNGYENEEFVVCHVEGRSIFNKTTKKEMLVYGNGYYHANYSCIFGRHDYFKNVVVSPDLQLDIEKIKFLKEKRGLPILK